MKKNNLKLILILTITLFTFKTRSQSKYSFNVMAPLHVKVYNNPNLEEEQDWIDFENQLKAVKHIGVEAVTTDVWWGIVEKDRDNNFDWSYYDRIATVIKNHGLKWVPIMSFHQCGGNVGDNFNAPLPNWLWDKLIDEANHQLPFSDFTYVSEDTCNSGDHDCIEVNGTYRKFSKEYVSLWTDKYVQKQYSEFMNDFKNHFKIYADIIDEINISCGPSGELRYPSYNSHDGGGYPNRGRLQSYSNIAVENLKDYVKNKYQTLQNLNKAWGTTLNSFNQITPPSDPEYFFTHQDYKNITYGHDFIDWYNQSLMEHGNRMVNLTNDIFKSGDFSSARIGFKIPGVHWQIGNYYMPRSAELTSGLLASSGNNLNCDSSGYINSLKIATKDIDKNRIVLHFTCLEMNNEVQQCNDPNNNSPYSMAKALVFWVGSAAKNQNILIKGENALASDHLDWNNINNAFEHSSYKGITILRINNISNSLYNTQEFKSLINKYNQ